MRSLLQKASESEPGKDMDKRSQTRLTSNNFKCDGKTPCSACQERNLKCETSAPRRNSQLIIVDATRRLPSTPSLLVPADPVSLYLPRFFSFIGMVDNTPWTIALSYSSLGPIAQCNEAICDAIVAVGAAMATAKWPKGLTGRNETYLTAMSAHGRSRSRLFDALQQDQTAVVTDETFICALLISLFEMMLDKTTTRLYNFLRQILRPLGQQRRHQGLSNRFEASLLHLYATFEIMCSAFFYEDSIVADQEWTQTMSQIGSYIPLTVVSRVGVFGNILARLLRLRTQQAKWLRKVHAADLNGLQNTDSSMLQNESSSQNFHRDSISHSDMEWGQAIVEEASSLQNSCLEAGPHLQSRHPDKPKPNMLYYHCSLIIISRLFVDPLWSILFTDLPILPQHVVEKHALEALELAEWWLPQAQFGAVFAIPGLIAISLELRAFAQRERVSRLFQLIAEKGFSVASTAESDVAIAWSAVPSQE